MFVSQNICIRVIKSSDAFLFLTETQTFKADTRRRSVGEAAISPPCTMLSGAVLSVGHLRFGRDQHTIPVTVHLLHKMTLTV